MQLINKILTELEDPKNREIVNSGQDYFDVDISDNLILFYSLPIEELSEIEHFFIARHCINLLPCFEGENPEYQATIDKFDEPIPDKTNYEIRQLLLKQPKTIRQALLCSGAMTVEDLEQEYLKLIN